MTVQVTMTVNGAEVTRDIEPRLLLVHFLREELGLTGTNVGCDTSVCGACAVLMNGEAVKSCTVLAVQADGEPIGETPVTVDVVPGAVRLLRPCGLPPESA